MGDSGNKALLEELLLRTRAPPNPAYQSHTTDTGRSPYFQLASVALLDSLGNPVSSDLGGLKWAVGVFVPANDSLLRRVPTLVAVRAHFFEWSRTPRGLWLQREDGMADEQAHLAYASYLRPITICRQLVELLSAGLAIKDIIATLSSVAVADAVPFLRAHLKDDKRVDFAVLNEVAAANSMSAPPPPFVLKDLLVSVGLVPSDTAHESPRSKLITIDTLFANFRQKQQDLAHTASTTVSGPPVAASATIADAVMADRPKTASEKKRKELEPLADSESESSETSSAENVDAAASAVPEALQQEQDKVKPADEKKGIEKGEMGKKKKKKTERAGPKVTSYLLWSKDVIQKMGTEGTKMTFAERGKFLSEKWKGIEAQEKSRYKEMAQKMVADLKASYVVTRVGDGSLDQDVKAKLAKEGTHLTFAEAGKFVGTQWATMSTEEKQKWNDLAAKEQNRLKEERGKTDLPAKKAKKDKPKLSAEEKEKLKEQKQLARQQLQEEKKEHGLEDMDLPHAHASPPKSHTIECDYPEHFGQLLVIHTMLNAFGELLNLRPMQYRDLEVALKESSILWEEIHLSLLKFLTQETDTSAAAAATVAAVHAAEAEDGDVEPAPSTTPFSLVTVLRFTWASHSNWPEIARKYLLAQAETELAAALGAKEYAAVAESHKIALLEFLCNEFMTKSVAFRKYLDESSNKLEELRKEKWQEVVAERQAKKKEKEEAEKPVAPVVEEPEADILDRKAAAKKRKAEQEAAREQRRLAEEQRREEKKREQRRVQMNVIRGQLRASVCIGLDRSRRRYWLFNISSLDRRLLIEDPVSKKWATYETPEEFEALLKWLNKNGVRERKLLKKLQKSKDDILEKIRTGPLQLFLERGGRSLVTTRSEAFSPLDEARKQLLILRASVPAHGIGGNEKEWARWEKEVNEAPNVKALIPPLLALEGNIVPDANVFIPFWTLALARAWREELGALRENKEPFTAAKFFLYFEALQYSIRRESKDEIADKRCKVCRSAENDEKMLLCDRCDAGYHIFCLKPPLKTIPQDDWFCARCRASNAVLRSNGRRNTRRSPR